MNLRTLRIGPRLALGFGFVLLACIATLVATFVATTRQRDALQQALEHAAARQGEAEQVRGALFRSAVAMRNMALIVGRFPSPQIDRLDEPRRKDPRGAIFR